MTEAEWLACTDPTPMLQYLRGSRASDRKLRLFAVACCRCIWHLLADERSRKMVDVAESYADGLAREEDLGAAYATAREITTYSPSGSKDTAAGSARDTGLKSASAAAFLVSNDAAEAVSFNLSEDFSAPRSGMDRSRKKEARWSQATLLKDIFGNPFRPVVLGAAVLAWDGRTIPRVAQSIYDARAFDNLPIVADSLEEAGCNNADVLNHCRQPGPHVRGCWAVDLVLGKG